MNPLIHSAFRIIADKLLIDYKNKNEKQKKDLDGFHYAQKVNKIYLPSYYNIDNCVICNCCIKNNTEKYKDMVWKSNIDYLIFNKDHSVLYNYDEMTDIYMCYECAKNETMGEHLLDTFNYELFGKDYIDCDKNTYYSLGICTIKNINKNKK
jgi:hypothetical protein